MLQRLLSIVERTDWIQNRVEWRLSKHPGVTCLQGDAIPSSCVQRLSAVHDGPIGRPLIAFTDLPDRWTILASESIGSFFDGSLQTIPVHGSFHVGSPTEFIGHANAQNPKRELQYLMLHSDISDSITVWAPRGSPCFALWNVLLMFPFK